MLPARENLYIYIDVLYLPYRPISVYPHLDEISVYI